MSNYLTTFSGKAGDILWSLATVKKIAEKVAEKSVDFACMPQYESLLPLIQFQSYVDKAFVIPEWLCSGSPWGDQPWQSPETPGYSYKWDLTYRRHPSPTPLVKSIADHWGYELDRQPFIEVPKDDWIEATEPFVAYAFNPSYADVKSLFISVLRKSLPEIPFINVVDYPWLKAALWIRNAVCFVGCRSSNYVIAHGVGQRVICFEPEPWRTEVTYSCPWGIEVLCQSPDPAIHKINEWRNSPCA